MYIYGIMVAILTLIGWGCLRKKFSMGLGPVILCASIISGVICVCVFVTQYEMSGPTNVWNDTLYFNSTQKNFSMSEEDIIGTNFDLEDLDTVSVRPKLKTPAIMVVRKNQRRDMRLFWNIGYTEVNKRVLLLNQKQYAVYKTFKDSLEQRKDSL
jgi:hypothetical protein